MVNLATVRAHRCSCCPQHVPSHCSVPPRVIAGDCTSRQQPARVASLSGATSVSCGYTHTLAVARRSADGTACLWSWGSGRRGELGRGVCYAYTVWCICVMPCFTTCVHVWLCAAGLAKRETSCAEPLEVALPASSTPMAAVCGWKHSAVLTTSGKVCVAHPSACNDRCGCVLTRLLVACRVVPGRASRCSHGGATSMGNWGMTLQPLARRLHPLAQDIVHLVVPVLLAQLQA